MPFSPPYQLMKHQSFRNFWSQIRVSSWIYLVYLFLRKRPKEKKKYNFTNLKQLPWGIYFYKLQYFDTAKPLRECHPFCSLDEANILWKEKGKIACNHVVTGCIFGSFCNSGLFDFWRFTNPLRQFLYAMFITLLSPSSSIPTPFASQLLLYICQRMEIFRAGNISLWKFRWPPAYK